MSLFDHDDGWKGTLTSCIPWQQLERAQLCEVGLDDMDLEVEKKNSPELQGQKPWLAVDVLPQSHFWAQLWTYEDQDEEEGENDGSMTEYARKCDAS